MIHKFNTLRGTVHKVINLFAYKATTTRQLLDQERKMADSRLERAVLYLRRVFSDPAPYESLVSNTIDPDELQWLIVTGEPIKIQ